MGVGKYAHSTTAPPGKFGGVSYSTSSLASPTRAASEMQRSAMSLVGPFATFRGDPATRSARSEADIERFSVRTEPVAIDPERTSPIAQSMGRSRPCQESLPWPAQVSALRHSFAEARIPSLRTR